MTDHADVKALFLAGARVAADAIADPLVALHWDDPSVLEEQLVRSLAGHLARGGVWVVADYLSGETPVGEPDFGSVAEYFAAFTAMARPEDHAAVRARGAEVASIGREALLAMLQEHTDRLEEILPPLPGSRLMSVIGGRVIRLDSYLGSRIVEQAVHLDDLARSVGRDAWDLPDGHRALAVSIGVDIARLRHGENSLLRAIYRAGAAEAVFPVL